MRLHREPGHLGRVARRKADWTKAPTPKAVFLWRFGVSHSEGKTLYNSGARPEGFWLTDCRRAREELGRSDRRMCLLLSRATKPEETTGIGTQLGINLKLT